MRTRPIHRPPNPRKFSPRNLSILPFRESFLPRKFPAIYTVHIMYLSDLVYPVSFWCTHKIAFNLLTNIETSLFIISCPEHP